VNTADGRASKLTRFGGDAKNRVAFGVNAPLVSRIKPTSLLFFLQHMITPGHADRIRTYDTHWDRMKSVANPPFVIVFLGFSFSHPAGRLRPFSPLESVLRSPAGSELNDGLQLFIEWYLCQSAPLWT